MVGNGKEEAPAHRQAEPSVRVVARNGPRSSQNKNAEAVQKDNLRAVVMVAGAGFEPTTFGL